LRAGDWVYKLVNMTLTEIGEHSFEHPYGHLDE